MKLLAMEEAVSYRRSQLQRSARPRRQPAFRLRHALGGRLIRLGRLIDVPAGHNADVGVPSASCQATASS
jgi:hypothetical protein